MNQNWGAPGMPQGGPALSPEDVRHLRGYQRKSQLVCDCVTGVAKGYTTGCYVYGPGGHGKTHIALDELKRLSVPYNLTNSRLSAAALAELLAKFSEHIHVLDDLEEMLRDRHAVGILRSALWPQDSGGRRVTYRVRGRELDFTFRGGIVMLGNRKPGELPEIQALLTRIAAVEFAANDSEIAAMMRQIAQAGYLVGDRPMSPVECQEVVEFVIQESFALGRPLDLRLLHNSFAIYLQWADCDAGHDWQSLVKCQLGRRAHGQGRITPADRRAARLQAEFDLVRELAEIPRRERIERWQAETGKSEKTYYRRLEVLGQSDSQCFED